MRFLALLLVPLTVLVATAPAHAASEGQMTWAVPFSIARTWFDPGEHQGLITSMMTFYALHDALMKPMPGNAKTLSLAESWSASKDGLTYEFVLRKHVRFHNGDVMTADDVKFTFERYRGAGATLFKKKVAAVEVADTQRIRFRLKEPWPDFMTFFGTPATGASWVVPKKYLARVGDDGFQKAPIGAGPYRFVSFTPGVELALESHDGFWRKPPGVKRLVFKIVPDESTRLVMLKRGEVDIAYNLRGPLAEEVRRTPGLKLMAAPLAATFWIDFTGSQWDPKSPWYDRRIRLAASLAIDRKAINETETLGLSKVASSIIPAGFELSWHAPELRYDPERARKLLAEAGYPRGFDAGDYTCDISLASVGEAVVHYLGAIGVVTRLRPLERVAFLNQWREKKVKGLLQAANAGFGNAATRIERDVISSGAYAFGSYPEIDDLFQQQQKEIDPKKREALLHQIQQIAYERVMFVPIWEIAQLAGVRQSVDQPGLGLIEYHPYSSPYEELRLKKP